MEKTYENSEEFRHECECRHVVSLPGKAARLHYLGLVEDARGKESVERITKTVSEWLRNGVI